MGKKILVIDDNEQELMILKRTLTKAGYEDLIFAGSAEEGIEKAKTEKPNLIIADINMPKKTGIDVHNILKQYSDTKDIPVIFQTSLIRPGERPDGGNNQVFPKTHFSEDLIKKIRELIG